MYGTNKKRIFKSFVALFSMVSVSFVLCACAMLYKDMDKYYKDSKSKQKRLDNVYLELILTQGNKTIPSKMYISGERIRIEKSLNNGKTYGIVVIIDGKTKSIFTTNASIGQKTTNLNDGHISALNKMKNWGDGKDLKTFVYKENVSNEEMNCALFQKEDKKAGVLQKICVNNFYGTAVSYNDTSVKRSKNLPAQMFREIITIKNVKARQKFNPTLFKPPAKIKMFSI